MRRGFSVNKLIISLLHLCDVGRINVEYFSNLLSQSIFVYQITEKKSIKANKSLVIFFTLSSCHRIFNLQITLRTMNKKWTKILEKMQVETSLTFCCPKLCGQTKWTENLEKMQVETSPIRCCPKLCVKNLSRKFVEKLSYKIGKV